MAGSSKTQGSESCHAQHGPGHHAHVCTSTVHGPAIRLAVAYIVKFAAQLLHHDSKTVRRGLQRGAKKSKTPSLGRRVGVCHRDGRLHSYQLALWAVSVLKFQRGTAATTYASEPQAFNCAGMLYDMQRTCTTDNHSAPGNSALLEAGHHLQRLQRIQYCIQQHRQLVAVTAQGDLCVREAKVCWVQV
jgi:hypothetical protein